MSEFPLIPKERIPSLRFPSEPLALSTVQRSAIKDKLEWATRLGSVEHGKCRIVFQDDEGVKAVETTIWAFDTENVVLKYGMSIPLSRVQAIEIP